MHAVVCQHSRPPEPLLASRLWAQLSVVLAAAPVVQVNLLQ